MDQHKKHTNRATTTIYKQRHNHRHITDSSQSHWVGDILNTIHKYNNAIKVNRSKKEDKDHESIQSSTTPDPRYQWESDNFTIRHHKTRAKRSALSQQVTTRHQ